MREANSRTIAAVDFFCGLGGLSLGLRQAGIDLRAGIDVDPACRIPYEANNPDSRFIEKDIRSVESKEISTILDGADATLLAGCAPCQPFSSHSHKFEPCSRPGWDLLTEFGRLVEKVRPTFVTMENVPGMAKHDVFKEFTDLLRRNHYEVALEPTLDCSLVGVPQKRTRLVLVASKSGEVPVTLGAPLRTVKDAIGGLSPIGAGEGSDLDPLHFAAGLTECNLRRVRASRPGGSWKDWPEDLLLDCHKTARGKSYTPVYGRMEWNKPSPTITTQFYNYGSGRFGHPEQDRALTPREALLLQGFPPDFSFGSTMPTLTQLGRLIGNSVPPPLAYSIGKAIIAHG